MKVSIEEEIRDVFVARPHVVILGAGASRAAFPRGDRNGKALPLMTDLVELLDLGADLDRAGFAPDLGNFEEVYSQLAASPEHAELRDCVEQRVSEYFGSLRLPDEPTIYDYLMLSLRAKDVVATFNWDPFLYLAWERNGQHAECPRTLFLHGCAILGFCQDHGQIGRMELGCSICEHQYTPMRLLFPVSNKDYARDVFVQDQWSCLRAALRSGFLLTIFGYGAPESDAAAVELMKEGWGERKIEEIEIIDVLAKSALRQRWAPFIFSHHYSTTDAFFRSLLSGHPRRSCESVSRRIIDGRFVSVNPLPRVPSLTILQDAIGPLLEAERCPRNRSRQGPCKS